MQGRKGVVLCMYKHVAGEQPACRKRDPNWAMQRDSVLVSSMALNVCVVEAICCEKGSWV